jgi:hypothetical protein
MPPWPSDRPNRGPGRARSEAGPSCPRSARPSLLCSAPPTRRRLRASSSARRSPWRVARLARDPHPTSRRRCRYVTSARRAFRVCPEEGVGDWWRLRSFSMVLTAYDPALGGAFGEAEQRGVCMRLWGVGPELLCGIAFLSPVPSAGTKPGSVNRQRRDADSDTFRGDRRTGRTVCCGTGTGRGGSAVGG